MMFLLLSVVVQQIVSPFIKRRKSGREVRDRRWDELKRLWVYSLTC
jgi:hypothetical protein